MPIIHEEKQNNSDKYDCNGNFSLHNRTHNSIARNGLERDFYETRESNNTNRTIYKDNLLYKDIPINNLVLWRHPIITLKFFILQINIEFSKILKRIKQNKARVCFAIIFLIIILISCYSPGPHQNYLQKSRKKMFWCIYWIGLGILSSVGLGTGLHTFVLYLGPHIASVTIAAYECNSLKFPSPPYPDEIICPLPDTPLLNGNGRVSLIAIMRKVYLEAFMWGAGTALGELPPYFMARAARTSGSLPYNENYEMFEELLEQQQTSNLNMHALSYLDQAKLYMQNLVQNVGFYGILLCASIPNPLFDFAGITCGHFNVPFWTFFGATLIGKAIIKVHLQELFVIIVFSEHHVDRIVHMLKYIPFVGSYLQAPFKEYLVTQKAKLHQSKKRAKQKVTWLSWCFEKILLFMIVYFVVSIVNSMAQKYKYKMEERNRKINRQRNIHDLETSIDRKDLPAHLSSD